VDFGLLVAPQNRWREVGRGHASRSNGLLHVEASQARVFQSGLKTGGCMTTGGREGYVGDKFKTDGSIRWVASDPATLPLPFSMY
jgi:hypothetical protein